MMPGDTGTLGRKVAPPSTLAVTKYWAVRLVPPELRASYQLTATLPVTGSEAMAGRYCEKAVWSSLTRTGWLHVVPLSSEVRTKMSRSSEVVVGASEYAM